MAENALLEIDGNNDTSLYGHYTCGFKAEVSAQFISLEERLTEMVWQDDSSGLISLVKKNPDDSQEFPCRKEDVGLDPTVAARLLQLACKLDSVACTCVLVEGQTGADLNINEMDVFGRSPLHNAAEMLSAKCIDLLLGKHARTDLRSMDGDALLPLEIALASHRVHVNWSPKESVEKLLVSLKDMDLNAIRLLVEATKNLTELSAMMAVKGQVIELASLFLVDEDKVKGEATFTRKSGSSLETNTTMYELVLNELLKLLEMAKNGRNWKSIHMIYEKRLALLRQIELLHLFGVASMVSSGDKKALLPLLRASQAGDELLVEVLLKQNVNVNDTNEDGNSSLHCYLKANAISQNLRILQYLLEHGARVYVHNKLGFTPFHLASLKGNFEALKMLLLHAPEYVDILSVTNETPLFLAVKNNSINCVKLLLQFGASTNALNLRRQRPIDLALSEEMRSILRTKIEPRELDEKTVICRYFHSPNGCGRGSKCYYSHGEQTQKLELKPRNKDPGSLKDDLDRKIFVGGLPPSIDSVELKKLFEEEFGPVEDAIVIGTKGGSRVLSKGFGFLTFKQEDTQKLAVKTHFITISGKTVEIKSVVPKYQGVSSNEQLVKINELPPWLAAFKKWLPAYLKKACRRLGEGEWYPLSSLKGDFRATCEMELDHESLGFLKLSDFLRSLPGICRMHVISSGIGSPTHMVLQPFYSFPSNEINHCKHTSSSSSHSPSSKLLSPTNSCSNSEFSDITSSSNESVLQECVSVEKSGFPDGNPNLWMWEPKPHWLVGGSTFLQYDLWRNFGTSEQETAAGKGTRQPFSYFVHQWDSGLVYSAASLSH
ncbi:Heterogeneous nuclear ribonucleoprotein 1 [Platanthera guangdongensis]|uniref:Heterogeneous nuclear ribonucleoprotein 1 n=1 Tax=Platanthera guangdongensis TaxID=2320717 RepID=A0ABR2M0I3_9ASPA